MRDHYYARRIVICDDYYVLTVCVHKNLQNGNMEQIDVADTETCVYINIVGSLDYRPYLDLGLAQNQ